MKVICIVEKINKDIQIWIHVRIKTNNINDTFCLGYSEGDFLKMSKEKFKKDIINRAKKEINSIFKYRFKRANFEEKQKEFKDIIIEFEMNEPN